MLIVRYVPEVILRKVGFRLQGKFKKETFIWHAKSKGLIANVRRGEIRQDPASAPLAKCVTKIDDHMFKHLRNLFTIAYFIGLNEKPFFDFPIQVQLARRLKVDMKEQYVTDKMCRSFIHYIAKDLFATVVENAKQK